jgi:hypothetical protein
LASGLNSLFRPDSKQFELPFPLLPEGSLFDELAGNHSSPVQRIAALDRGIVIFKDSQIPEDPTSRLLEYYGQYVTAKRQNEAKMIWLSAVGCRRQLQKMGYLDKEAKYCQKIFEPFVGKKQAEQIYRDLCDDSRSFPVKSD